MWNSRCWYSDTLNCQSSVSITKVVMRVYVTIRTIFVEIKKNWWDENPTCIQDICNTMSAVTWNFDFWLREKLYSLISCAQLLLFTTGTLTFAKREWT